MAVNPLQS
uniref:Uncharacterized protein n=1 Tax=Anguilla anguilla TaxID=7936 RepID=A0A0E9SHV5_ANGAN